MIEFLSRRAFLVAAVASAVSAQRKPRPSVGVYSATYSNTY